MSKIEWTEQTWNPIVGCSKLRAGCANCYAIGMAARLQAMGLPRYQAVVDPQLKQWTGKMELVESALELPVKWRRPRRIFVCSMSDLFHEKGQTWWLTVIFKAMTRAPQHTYQLVTKRYTTAVKYLNTLALLVPRDTKLKIVLLLSASTQYDVDEAGDALSRLRRRPGICAGLCLEPLLEKVILPELRLDWVIVGGESGPQARPMHLAWLAQILGQCSARDIPFFFKQWGTWYPFSRDYPLPAGSVDVDPEGRLMFWDARGKCWSNGQFLKSDPGPDDTVIRLGKRAAGRRLCGHTWEEYPKIEDQCENATLEPNTIAK